MIKEFSQNRNNIIMNFSLKYCQSKKELLESVGFSTVLKHYIKNLEQSDAALFDRLQNLTDNRSLDDLLLELFKLLIVLDTTKIKELNDYYENILDNKEDLFDFIEGLYFYWRHLERYALIQKDSIQSGIEDNAFIKASNDFSDLVLEVYRLIEHNLTNTLPNVYRQARAGINVGFVLSQIRTKIPTDYNQLSNISFINKIILTPPFIMYPKENKREGVFKEVFENPLKDIAINEDHFFCYVAKVGGSLAYVYFHRDFLSQGIALANLFELAKEDEIEGQKPDLIYVFGARNASGEKETVYFDDKKNDVVVGYASNNERIDYFGYMKKLILTLHNTRMLNKGLLPIHGAMVNITLKNGRSANVAIVGDSGAGKSESLEAFRTLSQEHLKEMKIIFDDMGSFKIVDKKVFGYGTEIGAFVRLDDLDMGYPFKEMDRAIFMNPNRINARVLLPITTYETIQKGFEVDVLLYANNYIDKKDVLRFFSSVDQAKDTFIKGARKAKGTTAESGLVTSFFANPFGPLQRQDQTIDILNKIFDQLFENKIPVGEIYTKLAVDGYQRKGPEQAALALFDWLL
jgi:hypothetical protein